MAGASACGEKRTGRHALTSAVNAKLRIITIITAHLTPPENNRNRKQPKVDKALYIPIIVLVIMAIREIKSRHTIASDFQNSLLFFPVLRERGIIIGIANLWMIGGDGASIPRSQCAIR
jgi:hypothetical protein